LPAPRFISSGAPGVIVPNPTKPAAGKIFSKLKSIAANFFSAKLFFAFELA